MICNEYKNKAEILVHECGEDHVIFSNEVDIKKIDIRVKLKADKCCVFEGDCIEYTVIICNESCIDLEDVNFCDFIPQGLKVETDTFMVNYVKQTPEYTPYDNRLSYTIPKLCAGEEAIITFTTKVK